MSGLWQHPRDRGLSRRPRDHLRDGQARRAPPHFELVVAQERARRVGFLECHVTACRSTPGECPANPRSSRECCVTAATPCGASAHSASGGSRPPVQCEISLASAPEGSCRRAGCPADQGTVLGEVRQRSGRCGLIEGGVPGPSGISHPPKHPPAPTRPQPTATNWAAKEFTARVGR